MHAKLFLLSSIEYTAGSGGDTPYVASLLGMARQRSEPPVAGDRALDGGEVCYAESPGTADAFHLDVITAIDRARGMVMTVAGTFHVAASTQTQPTIAGIRIADIDSHLLYDAHACFVLVTEVAIDIPDSADTARLVEDLFSGHRLFDHLGVGNYMDAAFAAATHCTLQRLEARAPGHTFAAGDLRFSEGNTLPVLISGAALKISPATFRSEGSAPLPPDAPLVRDCLGAVFHPGWNYIVATGLPREALTAVLQLTLRAQAFYFSLGYMKAYFAEETRRTLAADDQVSQADIQRAEQVRLAFYDMLGGFNRYRNQLFPKYFDALNALTGLWHCMDDVADIKEYIALDIEAKDRRHARGLLKLNQRQNNALALIALLQLISIYGALDTARSMFGHAHWLFYAGSVAWVTILLIFLIMSRYTRTAIACAMLVALAALAWLGSAVW